MVLALIRALEIGLCFSGDLEVGKLEKWEQKRCNWWTEIDLQLGGRDISNCLKMIKMI
jgi:hypothetical protein